MDSFSIFLKSTDWITVGCFFLAGIWFGITLKTWTVRGTPREMKSLNRILKRLKSITRKHTGKRKVTLADVDAFVNSTF